MKQLNAFFLLSLGIVAGFIGNTHFTHRQVACIFQRWDGANDDYCSGKYLERGDKLKLNLEGRSALFYKNCQASYIAGQAIQGDNVVWVYLTKCDFQKEEPTMFGDPMTDQFSLRQVEKVR